MKCDFPLFLAVWNAAQKLTTPRVHLKIARWLDGAQAKANPRLLLMAFRSCGKSTLVGVFCAWLFLKSPDTRILVLSADLALARKMVRNVKRIIEKHPMTKHLIPDHIDQWGSDKFTIKRPMELRDPSMLAKGITTNLTGTRADVIICDDVEVPNTSDSAEKRLQLRERLLELDYILTPSGMQLYVGTPHCWHTIYADEPRMDIGEDTPFLNGFDRLVQPILTPDGESVWPERFPLEGINGVLKKTGPLHFKSQMMCEPVNIYAGKLDTSNIQYYDEDTVYYESGGQPYLTLCGRKITGMSGWWDPAFGAERGDRSILAIIYADEEGGYWLHHLVQMTIDPSSGLDEATQQCMKVAQTAKDSYLSSVALEINGIGKFLPNLLRREIGVAGILCGVREISNKKPKDIRILESFDAVLAARALHVHRSVLATPFIKEMEDWKPGKRGGHDDCLDAVAGAISLTPVRIPRRKIDGGHTWIAKRFTTQAKTDFDV